MSDIVDTSPLGIERTERIAGDEALNSRLDTVTTELQSTQESVTTEVLHRSEGDLVIQRILEGYIQDLLEGKAEDFERYIEFQNSQNLNYADVRNFVSSIRTSLADDIRNLSTNLMDNLQANDARYNKLVSDVGRYLEILSDITLDSNQITLDNGELRAGAWTILSQARAWDLEIINRLNGLSESVGDSLKDAVEEIQNQLPSTEETITKAIEELSKSPLIKELSDLLNQSIENDIAYELALLEQARKHANDMAQLAEDMRAEALAKAQAMEDYMAGEVTARITEVNKEVAARKEAIDLLTEDMLTRVDQDKADFQEEMLVVTNRIKSAEDGLTSEIQHRKDGDTSTLNALNTYKVSNDSAITGLSTSLSNNVTKTNANTTLITGLTARMTTAETGIESATTAAADAMSKATTAVSANNALSVRVDALAASITESDGTVVDVNAFNALKAEVSTVKGAVTGLVEDVTALESNYTTVNNKVTSQGTAIGTLNTKMTAAENSISQSANDITLLKTDISSINAGLLTKVDSQAFSQLSSDVSELDGKYTTQAGLVTDLRGSLDTTNVNVANAASAAQNALNTAGSKGKVIFGTSAPAVEDRLSQNLWIDTTGNANTPKRWNGSAWVVVTDKVATDALAAANAATTLANTKADTSAFNSLDQKVTVIDGKVSTNTNSITSLNGKIAIVEGDLATKLDSSAMVNYYTKQQSDDKALSTAAGEISKYDANLVIGGVNLLPNSDFAQGYLPAVSSNDISKYVNKDVAVTPIIRALGTADGNNLGVIQPIAYRTMKIEAGKQYTVSMLVSSSLGTLSYLYLMHHLSGISNQNIPYAGSVSTDPSTPTRVSITFTANSSSTSAYIMVANRVQPKGAWLEFAELQVEVGSKATSWSPATEDTQEYLEANATAIQNTNTEVSRVDGKTTVNSNAITGLTSRMGIVEGQVSTKAEASALQNYYTKTEAEANATTVAAGEVAKYDASLVIGGSNLQDNADFKTTALNHWTGVYGAVTSIEGGIQYKGTSVNSAARLHKTLVGLEVGQTYTLSVWAKSPVPLEFRSPVDATSLKYIMPETHDPSVFQRYTYTFIPSVVTGALLRAYVPNIALTDVVIINKEKLEIGSKGTDWSPSSSDIQASLDTNATAITNTNAEVSRVDGRVTTTSNQIIALTGRVSTVEGGLATKADVSAVNALTTRVGNVEGGLSTQANNTTKLEAKIDSRSNEFSLAHDYDTKNPAEWESHYSDRDLSIHFKTVTDGKIGNSVFRKDTTHPSTNYNYNLAPVPNDRAYSLSMWVRCSPDSTGSLGFNYKYTTDASPEFTTAYASVTSKSITKDGTWQLVTAIADFRSSAFNRLRFGFYIGHTGTAGWWEMQGFKVEAVVNADDVDGTLATATALTSTNTEVSRIDGVVSGHSTQLSNLTASIAGKADTSALNALTVRVAAEEGKSSSQATSITNLTASLSDTDKVAKDALPKVGGAGSFKTFKEVLNYHLATSGTSSNIVIETPITSANNMFRVSGKGYNYSNTKTVIDFEVSGYARSTGVIQHGATNKGTYPMRIRLGLKDGKLCVILSPNGNNFAYPAFTLDAAVSYGSIPDTFQDGWSASPVAEASLATNGITLIIEPSLLDVATEVTANASAVSTLDTKVIAIDGTVAAQASQLIVLTSDNNANKNALSVQGKVIDGVKASYMVKMETNGVIGGFGLIQSTGALGQVVTSFGVNANAFFIGAPASKKQPFIVTTTNQEVNGVIYPAGTYIDVALIANATIGNAKISDLDATKITAGTIDAARIGANSITADKLLVNGGNILYAGLDCFHHFTTTPPNTLGGGSLLLENVAGLFGPKRLRHISTTTNSYVYIHPTVNSANGWLKLTPGQRYVLSAYVSTTSAAATALQLVAVVREGLTQTGGVGGNTGVLSVKKADGWVRISVAFTPGGTNPHLAYYLRHSSASITSYWDGFMLEEVPAGVSSPSTFSPGGQTRIDGGSIVANSISADKISADAIETISLNARNGTFTASDGSKTVINGGLTQIYYPNGKLAIKMGVF